jgi:hypothetical protein
MLPDAGHIRREPIRCGLLDLDKTIISRSSTLAFSLPLYSTA